MSLEPYRWYSAYDLKSSGFPIQGPWFWTVRASLESAEQYLWMMQGWHLKDCATRYCFTFSVLFGFYFHPSRWLGQNDPVSLSPWYSTCFDFILAHLYELVMPTFIFFIQQQHESSLDCDPNRWLAIHSPYNFFSFGPLLGKDAFCLEISQYCFFLSLDLLKLVVQALCNQSSKNWFLAPSTFILTLILLISPSFLFIPTLNP